MTDADALAAEAASLDGYFSDAPLTPEPQYPPLNESFDTAIIVTNLPKVCVMCWYINMLVGSFSFYALA